MGKKKMSMRIFKWKGVYSETASQGSYKDFHFDNFREIIVCYLKLRHTLVKMPWNNFRFRTSSNLSCFIVDEKSLTRLNLPAESGTSYFSYQKMLP